MGRGISATAATSDAEAPRSCRRAVGGHRGRARRTFGPSSRWSRDICRGSIMSGPDRRTEKQKMLAGDLYRAVGDELAADNLRADRLTRAYNATGADEAERRAALLRDLLGAVGGGVVIRPLFRCDYGYNIRLGSGVFVNFGCIFLDVVGIAVGDGCQ